MIADSQPPSGNGEPTIEGIPPDIQQMATAVASLFNAKGARYWDCGLVCSRLYALGIVAFVKHLRLQVARSKAQLPTVQAHNRAVTFLQQMARGEASPELFEALREIGK